MSQGFGTVKAVLSGDTLILVGTSPRPGAPPPELQLSLSHLSAPRLSRHPEQSDEAFSWPSREFLRELTIGKTVRFRIDYRVDKISRSFGTIWLGAEDDADSVSVNRQVAAAGWARVASLEQFARSGGVGSASDEYETVAAEGVAAEAAGAGVFSPAPGAAEASLRRIVWTVPQAEGAAVAARTAGVPLAAVVEQVPNGSLLRVLVLPGQRGPLESADASGAFVVLSVGIAGVQCPRVPAPAAAPAPAPAPAAAAAAPAADAAPARAPGSWASKAPIGSRPAAAPAAAAGAVGARPELSPADAAVAAEARALTESLLLNRSVTLLIGGVDKFGNLFGRVDLRGGGGGVDVAAELLRGGFGRIADFSLGFTSPAGHAGALRLAERAAKTARARLWRDHVAAAAVAVGDREFTGTVIEVLSGDTLIVAVPRGPAGLAGPTEERKVSLACVRAPRPARRDEPDVPWAYEAKEFLRRSAIGREVAVTVDYVRVFPAGPGGGGDSAAAAGAGAPPAGERRPFVTLELLTRKGDRQNLAALLLAEGLAEVPKGRREDEDACAAFAALAAAEEAARAAKKGLHSGKEAPAHRRIADLSLDAAKAKAHFPSLQRARAPLRGIVEYVFAGNRVKLLIPSENCSVIFGLSAVRAPTTAKAATRGPDGKMRPGRAAEPLGDESLRFVRAAAMQQEVEVEAEDIDKNGTVLGPMWVGKGGARVHLGAELLRRGLAFGIHPLLERVREGAELCAAEAEARAAKRGVWEFYVEPAPEEGEEAGVSGGVGGGAASGEGGGSDAPPLRGTVCEISSAGRFFIHLAADAPRLAAVGAAMAALRAEHGTQGAMVDARKGRIVAALFDDGGEGGPAWFRARVDGRRKSDASPGGLDLHDVTFVDYGNAGAVTVQEMRPLPDAATAAVPPLAKECALAFIRAPDLKSEFGHDAAALLSDLAFERPGGFRTHGRDAATGALLVSVWSEDGETCVNEELLRPGLCRISRTEAKRVARRAAAAPQDRDVLLLKRLEAAQAAAKARRAGMWRYGDVGDSDLEKR